MRAVFQVVVEIPYGTTVKDVQRRVAEVLRISYPGGGTVEKVRWTETNGMGDRRKKDCVGWARNPPEWSPYRVHTIAKNPKDWPTPEPAEPKCKRRKRRLTSGY